MGLESEPLHNAATVAGAVGLFAMLRAFSLGATALTGVEAISNGVPAFREPAWRTLKRTVFRIGNGEYESNARYPSSYVRRTASTRSRSKSSGSV